MRTVYLMLYHMLTGTEAYHNCIRSKIIEHMKTIEHHLKPHLHCSVHDYLENSQMRIPGTWETGIEIFAAACLLSTDIFVYTITNNTYRWHLFSVKMLTGSSPENDCAIYIEHVHRVHYDAVIDVGEVQSATIGKCQTLKCKQSDN